MNSNIKYVIITSISRETGFKLSNILNETGIGDKITIINTTHHAGFKDKNQSELSFQMRKKTRRKRNNHIQGLMLLVVLEKEFQINSMELLRLK